MAVASLLKSLRFVTVVLCLALASVAGAIIPVQSASVTALRLNPATAQIASGETITLELWVDNVENLGRIELHLDYAWPGLEVQDAEPGRVGVQIEPGPVFSDACVQWNEVVNGEIHFVAQRDPVAGPFSGSGIVARITFLVTATESGDYAVSFDRAATRLFDDNDGLISVGQFTDAALVILSLPTLMGEVTREGWGTDERSVVNAVLYYPDASPYEPISWGRACTGATGQFTLEIVDSAQPPPVGILPASGPPSSPSCAYRWVFVRLNFTNYLSECYWECADGDVLDIGWHDLEGGDVNGDGDVNICDIVLTIAGFGERVASPCYIPCAECPPGSPPPNVAPAYDVNGDCQVNILDLTQAAGNFGLYSNCP